MTRFGVFVVLLLSMLTTPLVAVPTGEDVDKLANQALQEWGIPGLAVTVVSKGQTVRAHGYGVRVRGASNPIDADTLFQICSMSKAFTALTASMLVEEGKLAWERPVRSYLPNFRLKDPCATEQVMLRDLLSHRTGLPGVSQQSWMLWYHTNRSVDDLMRRLAYVEPASSLRAHFSYNNTAYAVAGQVIAKAEGVPWSTVCHQRIFAPLGMTRSGISYQDFVADKNVAAAHLPATQQEGPITWLNMDSVAPGSGIYTTAADMARWIHYNLS